jgi:hypothetical protein
MSRAVRLTLAAAVLLIAATFAVWASTGRHVFTKYRVPVAVEPDPLFSDTGLFDASPGEGVVRLEEEFHLGLLPSGPSGRDAVSVAVIGGTMSGLSLVVFLLSRRRFMRANTGTGTKSVNPSDMKGKKSCETCR